MGQLLQLIPRHVSEHLVASYAWQGLTPRKFTYWSHLGTMLFGQWSARKSLRDLVFSVNRQVGKYYHLGLSVVKLSTLADANKQRPAVIFEKTYYKLYERLSAELATQSQEAPNIKIIDSITIEFCASIFPWAKFRTRKGAIKLHTVLTGMLPQYVLVTDGKTHDRRAVQDLHFKPDDLLIFDRANMDFAWLYRLHQDGVWFVTRLKTTSCYEVIQSQAASGPVLADQIIRLSSPQGGRSVTLNFWPRPLSGPGDRQGICFSDQPPGPACPGGSRTLPPLADRTLFQMDQAKTEDQGFLRHLQKCRADPNLDHLDHLSLSAINSLTYLGTYAIDIA